MYPPASKLIKLIKEGGFKGDEALKNEIKNIRNICNIYCRPNSRPVVGLSMSVEINEIVVMDLKELVN